MSDLDYGLSARLARASDETRSACRIVSHAEMTDTRVTDRELELAISFLEHTEREAKQLSIHARILRRRFVALQRQNQRNLERIADRIVNERRRITKNAVTH